MTNSRFQLLWALGLCLLGALSAHALTADRGFRFVNGKCVDASGNPGYNTGFFGPCSDLRGTQLANFNFEGVDFSGSLFDSAELERCRFKNANLDSVDFSSAKLARLDLTEARMKNVKFTHTSFAGASLKGAKCSNCDFTAAEFIESDLSEFEAPQTSFRNAFLEGALLERANLRGADLTGANLKKARMSAVILSQATLASAKLNEANLSKSRLDDAKAEQADFTGASIEQAALSRGQFAKARFRRGNLKNADLSGSDMSEADVAGADLTGAVVENTKLKGATYNKTTRLPFSLEVASQLNMVFNLRGDSFASERDTYFYYKVQVKGAMTDDNVLKACKEEGLNAPCNDVAGGSYSDDKCKDVGHHDGNFPMQSLSQIICKTSPSGCNLLDNTFQYMGGKYGNASCGRVGGLWCASGTQYKELFALCVE